MSNLNSRTVACTGFLQFNDSVHGSLEQMAQRSDVAKLRYSRKFVCLGIETHRQRPR